MQSVAAVRAVRGPIEALLGIVLLAGAAQHAVGQVPPAAGGGAGDRGHEPAPAAAGWDGVVTLQIGIRKLEEEAIARYLNNPREFDRIIAAVRQAIATVRSIEPVVGCRTPCQWPEPICCCGACYGQCPMCGEPDGERSP